MPAKSISEKWLGNLKPGMVRELFEHLPNFLYFAKDMELRLMAGNQAFVQRCGFQDESTMIGKTDHEIFPPELATKFGQDDRLVIGTGKALTGIVELFPNRIGEPEWFVTDKVPLYDRSGKVAGLCGMVRSYEGARVEIQPYLELEPATNYLKRHYMEKISIPEVAKTAGLSVRHMERRFREVYRTSPQQYALKLRILEACELLAQSTLSITEIALQVGFYDHSALSRKFSELMGVSPGDYRNRYTRR